MKLTNISILAVLVAAWIHSKAHANVLGIPDRQERYAALECQNHEIFAIVNYYEHGIFRLSWGQEEKIIADDIPVMRHDWGVRETFTGKGIILDLPEKNPATGDAPRVGELKISKPVPKLWRDLRCVLHDAY